MINIFANDFVIALIILSAFFPGVQEAEFETIASRVANETEYDFENYSCDDFATELVSRLRAEGWFAFKEVVEVPMENCVRAAELSGMEWNNATCPHSLTFIVIPIESVSGEIITPEEWDERGIKWRNYPTNFSDCDRSMIVTVMSSPR